MSYPDYIQSARWRNSPARLGELAAADFRCRLCNAPTSEASLEVHHRTYERLGAEEAGDLTTLCCDCHVVVTDMLRRRRYAASTPRYSDVTPSIDTATPLNDPTR